MKIVIKGCDNVKLYSGKIDYESILVFVREQFPSISNFHLTFTDEDGEAVMLASQSDVDAMLDMYPQKQIMRVDVNQQNIDQDGHSESSQEKQRGKMVEEQPQKNQSLQVQSNDGGKDDEKQQKREVSRHGRNWKKMKKLRGLLQEQISQIVQERLQSMIPCILNRLQTNSNQKQNHPLQGLPHIGTNCTGCGISPIMGVRYKCPQCYKFDLCEKCEDKINHDHDLLKMKKPRPEEVNQIGSEERGKKILKAASKLIKSVRRSSSSQSNKSLREKSNWCRKFACCRRSYHHQPMCELQSRDKDQEMCEKRRKNDEEKKKIKVEKMMRKMCKKMGGDAEKYREFVQERVGKKFEQIMGQYKKQNCDEPEVLAKATRDFQKKLRKLSLYFSKDQEEFVDLVKENPDSDFKSLLYLIKGKGEQFDPEDEQKLKRMKNKLKRQSMQVDSWIIVSENSRIKQDDFDPIKEEGKKGLEKEEEKPMGVEEEKPMGVEEEEQKQLDLLTKLQVERKKSQTIREKGKILMEMKEIFGDNKSAEIFKFIEQNFQLGQEKIIEKWINVEFDKNKAN